MEKRYENVELKKPKPSPYASFQIPVNPDKLGHVRFEALPTPQLRHEPISLHSNYFTGARMADQHPVTLEPGHYQDGGEDSGYEVPRKSYLEVNNYTEVDLNQLRKLTGGKVRRIESRRRASQRKVEKRCNGDEEENWYEALSQSIICDFEDTVDACIIAELHEEPYYENTSFLRKRALRHFWGKDFENLDM